MTSSAAASSPSSVRTYAYRSRALSRYSASKLPLDVLSGVAMLRAALMRLLRRRAEIITLFALLVGPIAAAQAAPAPTTRATCGRRSTSATPPPRRTRSGSAPRCRARAAARRCAGCASSSSTSRAADGAGIASPRAATRASCASAGGAGRASSAARCGSSRRAGEPVLLRGRVFFQWRTEGGEVLQRESARTRRGHRSNAGADPPGYSASTCTITPELAVNRRGSLEMTPVTPISSRLVDPLRVVDRPGVELAAGARGPPRPGAA